MVNISLEDQPDLNDINACYRNSGGGFWIAVNDDRVVGTLGLINKNGICGILKKFFIKREFRGGEKGVSAAFINYSFLEKSCCSLHQGKQTVVSPDAEDCYGAQPS